MASLRKRVRADGSVAVAVLYSLKGQQTSATFDTEEDAAEFRDAVNNLGPERAMKAWDITPTMRAAKRSTAMPLTEWLEKYIASRTGVTKTTLWDYRSYLRNDIKDSIGKIPVDLLTRDDVAGWVQELEERDLSGKTIANRHGFLSAALNVAVAESVIPSNPAASTRLPRTESRDHVYLTTEEYNLLKSFFTPRWKPMLDFLVASGCRFGEASALKPSDVNRQNNTVRIQRGWKRTYDSNQYELGPTKTKKSNRLIDVEKDVLDALDYSHEFLFTNTVGRPVQISSFRNNVWYPALRKAKEAGLEKHPRIHDLRHCCASWMLQDGESLAVIQAHLGHESINTTISLYAHLDRRNHQEAAARIGRRLRSV